MSNATIISDCKVMRAATRRRSCSVKDLNRQVQSAVRRDTREELDGRRREGGTERPVASGPACHRAEAAGPINTQHGCRLLCLSLLMATTRSCFYCNTAPVQCFLPRLIDTFSHHSSAALPSETDRTTTYYLFWMENAVFRFKIIYRSYLCDRFWFL